MRAVYYGSIKNATASGCTPRIAGPTTSIPIPKRGMWNQSHRPFPVSQHGMDRLGFCPDRVPAQRQGMDIHFTDTLLLAHDGAETGHVTGILETRQAVYGS